MTFESEPVPGFAIENIRKDGQEWQARRFEKAEKVTEWHDWVYWDDAPSDLYAYTGGDDGFFESVDDLMAAIEDYNDDSEDEDDKISPPSYVWTCKECRMRHQFAEDLFAESLEEEAGEDAWDSVPKEAISKLDAALKEFYEATDKIIGYAPNYKKVLIIKGGEDDEHL